MSFTREQIFQRYYATLNGRAVHLVNNARCRARRLHLPFDLTVPWVARKLRRGVCEATGIAFDFAAGFGKGHRFNSFAPSLDRKVSARGYTKRNVKVVCWIYNRAKGAFPIKDLLLMARQLNTRKNK